MKKRLISIISAVLIMQMMLMTPSFAYFNRGTVNLQVGKTAVDLKAGNTVSVSVSIDPIKEKQLPGCGMAECPQDCGGTGCLNEYGECTCAGTDYETYYSSVNVASGNSAVATASYQNGTITIKGVGAGSTTVTVTGSMRQYTDAVKTISVKVTAVQQPSTSGSQNGTTVIPSTGSVTTTPTDPQNTQSTEVVPVDNPWVTADAATEESPQEAVEPAQAESEIVSSPRGVYEIVRLSETTDVKAYLDAAKENQRYVTFQKKNGDNVEYSWTFSGLTLGETRALDLAVSTSQELPDKVKKAVNGKSSIMVDFAENGELPGPADIYTDVSAYFADGTELNLYHYTEDGKLELSSENLAVQNGYVTFPISHCSQYVLVSGEISSHNLVGAIVGGASVLAIVLLLVGIILSAGRKKTNDQTE